MIIAVFRMPLDGQEERPFGIFDRLYRAIGSPRGGDKSRVGCDGLMVVAADLQVVAHQAPHQRIGDRRDRDG